MTTRKERLLVVEDEDLARKNLMHILDREGYDVTGVESGEKAVALIKEHPFDLVITDFKMGRVDGLQVLEKSKTFQPGVEVIIITGYATVDLAVKSMKDGAFYYIAKPYKIDQVRKVVSEALIKRRLQLENQQLRDELQRIRPIPALIGKSPAMEKIRETIRQVAPSDTNVLILGESGTGKEIVAKAIHLLSNRQSKRFVAFNCGSFTEELMANELFGHEKGAFTGADREHVGLLEVADGGTVFLDEIGDMPLTMQIKLLRVMQERELMRVGGVTPRQVNVRFLAATHRDLHEDARTGQFRQDLYYRLNVITIHIPPLAERREDIPLLAQRFLARIAGEMQKEVSGIDSEVMELLGQYSWPGNVRELENIVERAVALATKPTIGADQLPDHIRNLTIETYRTAGDAIPTLEEQEKRYIEWVLQKTEGNKTHAAKIMGIDRVSLWRKLKRFGWDDS
ncbi:sigma-54-dependent transcriptional regulator [Desulfosarcina ovata]|uniref:Sigma-54-dependent Fis family transcriptional regulator n=1 Tax=Desulfosarcina ovata subsp. ovata TaxID=2752305 RepID=A0A5K8AL77_9BACT|nr:sigma-54 dependent transcriptional regulator [Desulfosarcina ovata]BBO93246.1 sigma-54-dependent Fis family transcriptional regulator [Desulfosarcina ovata subsp. ovata]